MQGVNETSAHIRFDILKSIIGMFPAQEYDKTVSTISQLILQNPEQDKDDEDLWPTDTHVGFANAARVVAKYIKDPKNWSNCCEIAKGQDQEALVSTLVSVIINAVNQHVDHKIGLLAAHVNDYIETGATLDDTVWHRVMRIAIW